jgi:hypothetical protein
LLKQGIRFCKLNAETLSENSRKFIVMKYCLSILSLIAILSWTSCSKSPENLDNTFTSDAEGCGEFRVYKFNSDRTIGIAVFGNRAALGLVPETKTFSIGSVSESNLGVVVREYVNGVGIFACLGYYDTDPNAAHEYRASEGTVSINIDQDSVYVSSSEVHYKISVSLDNMILEHTTQDEEVEINHLEFNEVTVGDF